MKKISIIMILLGFLLTGGPTLAKERYGQKLCRSNADYNCVRVKRNQSWERLFPNAEQRDIVKRINRTNLRLWAGMVIAVPKRLDKVTIYDVAPFPRYIDNTGEKTLYISQKKLAWGAYDDSGELVWWGPISTGQNWCKDIGKSCTTPGGHFRVIRKQGLKCVSSAFPRRRNGDHGGAVMPYCMHFFGGYALHGSYEVPGYRASHGCVRMYIEDAKWLNEEFIETPYDAKKGTRVIVESVDAS